MYGRVERKYILRQILCLKGIFFFFMKVEISFRRSSRKQNCS